MPELPEVECLRRSLEPHLVGAVIASVRVNRGDVVGSRQGRGTRAPASASAATRAALLESARISRLDRRGKQLAIIADSGAGVVVHLGMSGRFLLTKAGEAVPPHTHVAWTFARSRGGYVGVRFTDPRRFGYLLPCATPAALLQLWSDMGPDALALGPGGSADARSDARAAVAAAIRGSRRAIKPALLDQRVVAGVGNIYADEACFAAKLDPHRPGTSLNEVDLGSLLDAVPAVLASAIDCGGTTLRDYVDAMGGRGSAQAKHAVYGRAGKACLSCGGVLASDRLGQRTTVWCPRCQR